MSSTKNLKISLHEILLATNNFSEANMIATGTGFGNVYRGQSEKHGILAIKRLDRLKGQGDREFGMEIALLSAYKHENLVSLVGFCDEDGEKILVYKYEKNGSLDKLLHRKDLSWERRLQICLDAGRGLRYLHDEIGSQHRVIHRDIKSANILLDENWKAKISDFGLSKIALSNVPISVIFSNPCGTYGYVDPEFIRCALTQKSDVYSFGVVLFEVLFGKLVSVPELPNEHKFLVKMAQSHYEKKTLDKVIDPDLRKQMNSASLSTFSTIAHQCLKNRRDDRPTMRLVVEELEKALGHQQMIKRDVNHGFPRSNEKKHPLHFLHLQFKESHGFLHDVYISFRYQDIGHYVDELCAGLEQEGLSTHKDDITPRNESRLLKAIEQSRSFIIIFSRNFAANSWNLDEVAKIIECMKKRRHIVIPIFCDTDHSDLQTQKGFFWEVMSKYDSHPRMEAWRNAIVEAINVPGFNDSYSISAGRLAKATAARIKGQ